MKQSGFDFGQVKYPCVMGIVNVTPDSFSDGGRFFDAGAAVERARRMMEAGAGIVDLGAEASSFFRAGVRPVEAEEQWRRLAPVLGGVGEKGRRGEGERGGGGVISVDTRSAEVARRAMAAGARIINDISAGTHDAEMLAAVAASGAGVILMHCGESYPENPARDDGDIIGTVRGYLGERVAAARAAGIPLDRIAVDPGIGFGKTMLDNWRLVLGCRELAELGVPVVIGASRKRFLETPPPEEIIREWKRLLDVFAGSGEHSRDAASAAVTVLAARRGAAIHRVHDVTLAMRALSMADSIAEA